MREGKIIGEFNRINRVLQQLMNGQQILNQNAGQMISQIRSDVMSISLYIETLNDYSSKWSTGWGLLPIGIYPGKQIFKKIYDKKVDDINKAREAYMKKQKEEAKKNENKEVQS
jgi:hypothetical protein